MTSLRWWFENRETGRITIAQFPNWPLFAIAAAMAVRHFAEDGTLVDDVTGWLLFALWLYWAGDELVRGVNPWRRLIGLAVVVWQLTRLPTLV